MAARLARLLIASADEGGLDDEGDGFVEGLGAHERHDIIAQLEWQHATQAAPLLRALLKLPAMRLDAARAALCLIQSDRLSGKAAFLCLSELRIAIVLHWERREEQRAPQLRLSGYSGRTPSRKAPQSDPPERRLEELVLLSEAVLDRILGDERSDGDTRAARAEPHQAVSPTSWMPAPLRWGEGHGLVVQLLPPLLRAADAVNLEKCATQVTRQRATPLEPLLHSSESAFARLDHTTRCIIKPLLRKAINRTAECCRPLPTALHLRPALMPPTLLSTHRHPQSSTSHRVGRTSPGCFAPSGALRCATHPFASDGSYPTCCLSAPRARSLS